MARSSVRKWSGRSALTKRQASRTYAKKQLDWVSPFNIECRELCLDPGEFCPNGGALILVSNNTLRTQYEGSLLVKRIVGNLTFRPETAPITQCDLGNMTRDVVFRMGLIRLEGTQNQAWIPDAVNPLQAGVPAFPAYPAGDFTEQRWLKLWNHTWAPDARITNIERAAQACCSNVRQNSYVVPPFVLGDSPGWVVPTVITTCIPCGAEPATNCLFGFEVDVPKAWTTSVNYSRPIKLSGGQSLGLYLGWERLLRCSEDGREEQPTLNVHGGIRMLLET